MLLSENINAQSQIKVKKLSWSSIILWTHLNNKDIINSYFVIVWSMYIVHSYILY